MNTITTAQAAQFLMDRDNFLILTHVRPDGDTTGCAAGLCLALRQAGKAAWVLENPGVTPLFAGYLEGLTTGEEPENATVVSVDIAARSLFYDGAQKYLDRVDLAIDHHPSQEFFAKATCLDSTKAACGQIICDIVKRFTQITPEVGRALYVALSTDCGCFQYSNTDAEAHRTAAELMESGFDPYPVNRRHFRTKTFKRLKLESLLVQGLELRDGGTTALVFLTRKLIDEVGADERDMDDISAFVGQIEGVKNGVTLKETGDGHVKISLRTDPGDLNASAVCALLGGGGHAAAAGGMVEGTMETVRQRVIDAIEQVRQE
ncbi:DHH family phosphoesterase [Colidextribacter sp. OB.20]|uniref:DHH family phosphoesterase n=1 Tax=Colidextribacter sp. OB.20 TaxID=2304568 RepID=UPI00191C68C0|nr:DHH family phosphoesterase [Colidextribacter sp. OB.20]